MNSDHTWWYLSETDRLERIVSESGQLTERRNAVLRMGAGQPAIDVLRENNDLRRELLTARLVAKTAIQALASNARTNKATNLANVLRVQLGEAADEVSADQVMETS